MPLKLEIVTPDHIAYSDNVDMVVLPAIEGEIGVLPMHMPLMTAIKPGELAITKGSHVTWLAVGEGFVEVTETSVSVLTDLAVEEAGIDETRVQEALDRAQAHLQEKDLHGEELATVEASIQKALVQLRLKHKRRG